MRFWLGVSVFCFMGGWLFLVGDLVEADLLVGGLWLVVGGVCAFVGVLSLSPRHVSGWYMLLVVPGLVGLLVVPFPFNVGFIFVLCGSVFVVLKWWYPVDYGWGVGAAGLLLSGGVLIAQAVMYWVYMVVGSHVHRVDMLSSVVAFLLNMMGLSAGVNRGLVFVQTPSGTFPISTTFEKLGLLPWLFVLVGLVVVVVVLFRRVSWLRLFVVFFVVSGVLVVVRYVVMVVWYVSVDDLSVFWDPWLTVVGFVPIGLVLGGVLRSGMGVVSDDPLRWLRLNRRQVVVGCMVFVCVGSVVGAVGYYDGGVVKQGRVLIDEVHSDWEDSVRPLDTEWFGLLSTYNYYSWAEWMNASFMVHRNVDQVLSEQLLSEVDVLILKCPTNSYSAAEIGAVTRFVEGGGGLWMIGDHTDVFGMNTFLNQIGSVFGIRFRNDATYMLGSGNMTSVVQPLWFGHPIMDRVSEVRFMTSCTLEAPLFSENVLLGRGLIAEPGTYATENFFRESIESAEAEFGMFLQMVAVRYGAGRVVAFTDSTVFSSFSFFSDGYTELTRGTLEYLNRENSSPSVNLVLWGVSIVFGIIAIILSVSQRRCELFFSGFIACVVAVGVVYPLVDFVNDDGMVYAELRVDVGEVFFDLGHSDVRINLEPTVSLFEGADNFGTLFVWSQRVGLTPRMVYDIDDSLLDADVLVVVNPSVGFEEDEVDRIHGLVERGGSVVVFDSIQNEGSTVNEVVGGFGLWVFVDSMTDELYSNVSGIASFVGNVSLPVVQISGGESLGFVLDNSSYIQGVEIVNESTGRVGRVVVVVDSFSFSNKVLGGPLVDPDEEQLALYDTIFYLYRYLNS